MKMYVFRDFMKYTYAGGLVVVIAESKKDAFERATELLVKETYSRPQDFKLTDPEVLDIQVGAGAAYSWEE